MIKKNSVFEYILFIILMSDYHSNVSKRKKKKKRNLLSYAVYVVLKNDV